MTEPLHLNGLDGANPLGFLAALGTLALCDRLSLHPRMAWEPYANSFRPRLCVDDPADLADRITMVLKRDLDRDPPAWCAGTIIRRPATEYRRFAQDAAHRASRSVRHEADFATAFASDAAVEKKTGDVIPTRYSFANGQGGKVLLRDYRDLVRSLKPNHIDEAICQPWSNADACKTFRWEPRDLRLYALRADDPGASTVYSTCGANALAFWGLTLLPSFPAAGGDLMSTGFSRLSDGQRTADYFSWPIWLAAIGRDTTAAMLGRTEWQRSHVDPTVCAALGVHAVFRCRRMNYQKSIYFSPATSA